MKRLLLLSFLTMLLISCGKTEKDLLKEMSGVWKAKRSPGLFIISFDDNNKVTFAYGDKLMPVALSTIDKANNTINLKKEPGNEIITFKQVHDKDSKSLNIVVTLPDGTQDELSFVRKASPDDLKSLGSKKTSEECINDIASAANAAAKKYADTGTRQTAKYGRATVTVTVDGYIIIDVIEGCSGCIIDQDPFKISGCVETQK